MSIIISMVYLNRSSSYRLAGREDNPIFIGNCGKWSIDGAQRIESDITLSELGL
jgi:hypothetical protein